MPLDLQYENGDRIVSNGNYATYTGALYKAIRLVSSEYTTIDGVEFGNQLFSDRDCQADTPAGRLKCQYYTEKSLEYLVNTRQISDLSVVWGYPTGAEGLALQIRFTDTAAGADREIWLPPAWAIK
jgi:hypothetical protein